MFDYEKIINKLTNFGELPEKKQKKTMAKIFSNPDFKDWYYGVGEMKDRQPMTPAMIQKLFNLLARPQALQTLIEYVRDCNHEEFDHTSCSLAFMVVDEGIEALNKANDELNNDAKNGEISSKDFKAYKHKSEKYTEYVGELLDALKDKCSGVVKELSKKSNLDKTLVYTLYFLVPDRKYIPKYKITTYLNPMLREVYKWVAANGVESASYLRWGYLFGHFFGNELTTSVAISILLEGVKRIEPYQDSDNFNDVKSVWNSLTNFALSELDNAPENVRKQMMELYIKKIDRIFKNGNGPRLRVNILDIPREFSNLADTVMNYSEKIRSITRQTMKPVVDMKEKYVDEPRRRREEEKEEIERRINDRQKVPDKISMSDIVNEVEDKKSSTSDISLTEIPDLPDVDHGYFDSLKPESEDEDIIPAPPAMEDD